MTLRMRMMLLLLIGTVACEATLQCELCGGEHETAEHVEEAMSGPGGVEDPQLMAADDLLLRFVTNRRSDGFVQVNESPYPSAVTNARINVFVSSFAVAEYLETLPNSEESDGMLPRGGFVVREIVNDQGEVTKLTALYRGPEGYNPEGGDFWFAATDVEGKVVTDDTGHRIVGAVSNCSACHAARASADFLFGVPADARASEFAPVDLEPQPQPEPEPRDAEPPPEPQSEPEPDPEPVLIDLSGYVIANVQADMSREQSTMLDIEVERGTTLVVARDASRDEFEAFWGPLPEDVSFVTVGAYSSGAPIVNGGETWELRSPGGATLDGPTIAGSTGRDYQRLGASANAWQELDTQSASPGVVQASLPPGVWITEWADADDFHNEFIEIAVR